MTDARHANGDHRDPVNREIVIRPQDGTAGVGVVRDERPGPHETKYRVEQLWDDGRAEPVYVGDETDTVALIQALLRAVHDDV